VGIFIAKRNPLVGLVHKRSRPPALRALMGIYSRLLERIEAGGFDVTRRYRYRRRRNAPSSSMCNV
jgi:hypothetical protein